MAFTELQYHINLVLNAETCEGKNAVVDSMSRFFLRVLDLLGRKLVWLFFNQNEAHKGLHCFYFFLLICLKDLSIDTCDESHL